MGETEKLMQAFIRKNGKSPLGRPRHREYDDIKMDVREMGTGNAVLTPIFEPGTSPKSLRCHNHSTARLHFLF
jgi:hypothetical protein